MNIHSAFKARNPILPKKRKNPYWDDEAEFTNNEARRELRAKLRARRQVNFILGSVLFHAITGAPPIVVRPKTIHTRISQPQVFIETDTLL